MPPGVIVDPIEALTNRQPAKTSIIFLDREDYFLRFLGSVCFSALGCFSSADFRPSITDDCSEPVTWRFAGCASDQPENGLGDGNTEPDCVVAADGQGFCVRSERQGMVPAAGGVVAGLVVAFGLTRFLGSVLYGVAPVDAMTFAVIPVVLLLVAMMAVLIPAMRAARVDPVEALRAE